MKTHLRHAALLLGAAAVLSACKQEQETVAGILEPDVEKIASQAEYRNKTLGNRTFALNLFRQAVAESQGENVLVSPFSANMALNMVWNGARGATKAELGRVLCNGLYTREQNDMYWHALSQALGAADPTVDVCVANSLWADHTTPFLETYAERNLEWYGAACREVNFRDADAAEQIDAWCREHTRGRIDRMSEGISVDTRLAVINTLVFSGEWQRKFDSTQTVAEPFTHADGSRTDVRMMRQAGKMPYAENNKWKMVELPYGYGAFSMVVWMPSDDTPLADGLAAMTAAEFYSLRDRMTEYSVRLKLPAFEAEYSLELHKEILPRMGMVRVFDPYTAELGDMSEQRMFVGVVQQKTFIHVDEIGTEATAATVCYMELTSAAEKSADFFADRPFAYAILENHTGTILFIGLNNHI